MQPFTKNSGKFTKEARFAETFRARGRETGRGRCFFDVIAGALEIVIPRYDQALVREVLSGCGVGNIVRALQPARGIAKGYLRLKQDIYNPARQYRPGFYSPVRE